MLHFGATAWLSFHRRSACGCRAVRRPHTYVDPRRVRSSKYALPENEHCLTRGDNEVQQRPRGYIHGASVSAGPCPSQDDPLVHPSGYPSEGHPSSKDPGPGPSPGSANTGTCSTSSPCPADTVQEARLPSGYAPAHLQSLVLREVRAR